MNAYELQAAAFDSANDCAAETVEYIVEYANGAFDLQMSDSVAQKILDCRAAWRKATDENGEGANNAYHLIQAPLEEIEL